MLRPDSWVLDTTAEGFKQAIMDKLEKAEQKYGWEGSWLEESRVPAMREDLRKHVEKGDPLDVAVYAMFLWYHGASTSEGQ